jgi:uncharacterized RDD family membrane protein YckC
VDRRIHLSVVDYRPFVLSEVQKEKLNFYKLKSLVMNYKPRHEFHQVHEFKLATIRKRFAAFFIDGIILILIYFGIVILFSLFDMNLSKLNVKGVFEVEMEMENAPSYLITILKILFGLLPVIYFTCLFYFWKGRTLGKYLLRLRVFSLYHEHLGLWHCIERSLGYFASALEFGFGFIQAFWNPNRMTLHDKIGETIVIELPRKKHKNINQPISEDQNTLKKRGDSRKAK